MELEMETTARYAETHNDVQTGCCVADRSSSPSQQKTPSMATACLPWQGFREQPFSPQTMGRALPYLDVISVQSKHLLPCIRKEVLDVQQKKNRPNSSKRNPLDQHHDHHNETQACEPATHEPAAATQRRHHDHEEGGDTPDTEPQSPSSQYNRNAGSLDLDELVRSVRLLVEPIAIPDLRHTGVESQFVFTETTAQISPPKFKVTAPNHAFEETQTKLFYATGAKNWNMREYIKETIDKHMAGLLDDARRQQPMGSSALLHGSQSSPAIVVPAATSPTQITTSVKTLTHKKKKKTKMSAYNSPTKSSHSPHKKSTDASSGLSSGARLSGSVSTSGLLNPELTRQAREILAQLRTNSNKVNDLIGS